MGSASSRVDCLFVRLPKLIRPLPGAKSMQPFAVEEHFGVRLSAGARASVRTKITVRPRHLHFSESPYCSEFRTYSLVDNVSKCV